MSLPNPLNIPPLLQKLQWVIDPVRFIDKATQQYPDIFTAKIVGFGETAVFVNHPQAIQEVFSDDWNKFAAVGELNKIGQPLLGDCSVLMLTGDRHKKRRKMVMPYLHGERMRSYGQIIINITEKSFKELPQIQVFSARSAMQGISLQVILQAIFGLYEGENCQRIKKLFVLLLDIFQSPLDSSFLFFSFLQKDLGNWSPWGKFVRLRQQLDELLYAEISQRRLQPDSTRVDILSLLISAQDEVGKPMTDEELRDELMTLMFGGHETTATSMAWALYWIHKLPEVREKLLQELDSLDSTDPMSIFRLPYLTAVCNETLRICPVMNFAFPRVVQEPLELLGYPLEPGTVVLGNIYSIHSRNDLYPQPRNFQPERFLERQFSAYEFLPFGGGARGCIGQAFALFEMKLVLATILSRYQLALADRRPERLQRRGFALGPANGVKMVITGCRVPDDVMSTANFLVA
jgi:unspecific monooxygenase